MCGLLGLLAPGGVTPPLVDHLRGALALQRHRGPDATDIWHDDDVVLGCNRLAVVDVQGSPQPVRWGPVGQPDRYVGVLDGEVYDHRVLRARLERDHGAVFATDGDAEVALAALHHLPGDTGLRSLRGMFALVVWDTVERRLLAARDPFGIKPLHLAWTAAGLAFSSEPRSLVALGDVLGIDTRPTATAVQDHLTFQYVPEPATMRAGITRLGAGHRLDVAWADPGPAGDAPDRELPRLVADQGAWFDPAFDTRPVVGRTAAAALHHEVRAALDDSVRAHLGADVGVGALLSGGIDSTAVAALAARHHHGRLKTFTAGFDVPGFSEVDVAARTADALGVEHVVTTLSAFDVADLLPRIVWHLDDPVADPALVPLFAVAEEAARHVTVVLSGEGADELFGGYRIYREPSALLPLTGLPGPARRGLAALADRLPNGMRGQDWLRRGALDLEERYYGNARIFGDGDLARVLVQHDRDRRHTALTAPLFARSEGWDAVARMQHVDLLTWLRGDILVKADRMTMAHGLELRTPFLDPRVWDVARRVPVEHRLRHGTTKHALRAAMRDVVPAHVVERPKLGFPVPVARWLGGELYGWARTVLDDALVDGDAVRAFVDVPAACTMLEEHRRGDADHGRRLWALLVTVLWFAVHVEHRVDAGPVKAPSIERPSLVMPTAA